MNTHTIQREQFLEQAKKELTRLVTSGLNFDTKSTFISMVGKLMGEDVVDAIVAVDLMVVTTSGNTRVTIESQRVFSDDVWLGVNIEVQCGRPLEEELAALAKWIGETWVVDVEIGSDLLCFLVPVPKGAMV